MPEVATQLKLRVSARSRKPGVVGRHGDAWRVRVAEPPEDGRANEALLRLLAEALEISVGRLALVSGHASRDKIVVLKGIDRAQTEQRLASAEGKGRQ